MAKRKILILFVSLIMLFTSATYVMGDPIPILNADFEEPELVVHDWVPYIPDWVCIAPDYRTCGVWNPAEQSYPLGACKGKNVAFITGYSWQPEIAVISQELSADFQPDCDYQLSVCVGARLELNPIGYKILLLAGEETIAEYESDGQDLNQGSWITRIVNYYHNGNSYSGKLKIEFHGLVPIEGAERGQVHFDDVKLEKICISKPPKIISLCPPFCVVGEIVSVWGKNFGDSQGEADICLGQKCSRNGKLVVVSWSDNRIDFVVPDCSGDKPSIKKKVTVIREWVSNEKKLWIDCLQ